MQARTSLIVVATALAAVFVLTYLAATHNSGRSQDIDGDGVSARADAPSGESAAKSGRYTSDPSGRRAAVIEDPSTLLNELVDVRVIHADADSPVPEAIVWWWPVSSASQDESTFRECVVNDVLHCLAELSGAAPAAINHFASHIRCI